MNGSLYEIRFQQQDKIKHWLYETRDLWLKLAKKDVAALKKCRDVHSVYLLKNNRYIGAIKKYSIISIRFYKDAEKSYEYLLHDETGVDIHKNDIYSLILQDNSSIYIDHIVYLGELPEYITKNLILKPNNQAIITNIRRSNV
jgi:hypothetical protein